MLRDSNEIGHRKGNIYYSLIIQGSIVSLLVNNMMVRIFSIQILSENEGILFSAGRDRLIKMWEYSVNQNKVKLIANFDEHSDWVN